MSYPRTPTTTTSAATTTPNETPNEPYDASPGTPTVSATPSASTPSKPPRITHRCFTHRYFRRRWGNEATCAYLVDESTRGIDFDSEARDARYHSHVDPARGNEVVPSRWQGTSRTDP